MSKSLEKIRDIKSLINEFYQGELSECARKSWLCFQQDCDDIKQDLELLEQLKQQRDSLAINNGELCVKVTDLQKENQELRKSNKEIEELYLKENKHWCEDTDRLRKENQKLLKENNELKEKLNGIPPEYDGYLYFAQGISNVLKENEKRKKAIEIIKIKCSSNSNLWLISNTDNYQEYKCFVKNKDHELIRTENNVLIQQEYDLLKEVLEYD